MMLTTNFSLAEAAKSQIALRHGLDNTPPPEVIPRLQTTAQRILQPARDHFGVPITPSSWYRSEQVNRLAGSKETSQHILGYAVDFEVPGVSNLTVAKWIAENLEFDQLILEYWAPDDPAAGWVHCSYISYARNRRKVLRFDGRGTLAGLV
jgi:zinc D-Ala-D-Ala carboxypeptidase